MDRNVPGSSVHGISQARILEWVAISFSRGSFRPRVQTHVSCTGKKILYHGAAKEAQSKTITWQFRAPHDPGQQTKDRDGKGRRV